MHVHISALVNFNSEAIKRLYVGTHLCRLQLELPFDIILIHKADSCISTRVGSVESICLIQDVQSKLLKDNIAAWNLWVTWALKMLQSGLQFAIFIVLRIQLRVNVCVCVHLNCLLASVYPHFFLLCSTGVLFHCCPCTLSLFAKARYVFKPVSNSNWTLPHFKKLFNSFIATVPRWISSFPKNICQMLLAVLHRRKEQRTWALQRATVVAFEEFG